jgi:hypothetical protein
VEELEQGQDLAEHCKQRECRLGHTTTFGSAASKGVNKQTKTKKKEGWVKRFTFEDSRFSLMATSLIFRSICILEM